MPSSKSTTRLRQNPLFKCGQSVARLFHPHINLAKLFSNEIKVQQRVLDPCGTTWHGLPIKDRREHELYLLIKDMILSSKPDVPKDTATFRPSVLDLVSKGQASAIKDDLQKLKPLLPYWVAACSSSFQLNHDSIWQQGFENEAVGGLLCPVSLSWLDPRILYQDMGYQPEKPWEGFLRNGLLVKAYRQIFKAGSSQRGISVASLVYTVSLAKIIQALSGNKTYVRGSHQSFYCLLICHLKERTNRDMVRSLLEWWERKLSDSNHAHGQPCRDSGTRVLMNLRANGKLQHPPSSRLNLVLTAVVLLSHQKKLAAHHRHPFCLHVGHSPQARVFFRECCAIEDQGEVLEFLTVLQNEMGIVMVHRRSPVWAATSQSEYRTCKLSQDKWTMANLVIQVSKHSLWRLTHRFTVSFPLVRALSRDGEPLRRTRDGAHPLHDQTGHQVPLYNKTMQTLSVSVSASSAFHAPSHSQFAPDMNLRLKNSFFDGSWTESGVDRAKESFERVSLSGTLSLMQHIHRGLWRVGLDPLPV
ncbi:hypothetical protein BKA70DRAFT_1239593 [Coprinopsis sp. MPI-PUGE-AT-0042]|nr:hypothetical protein BKA70DRAFT_1239593 [Coprinopsis sp. MPI-PUGE-AT-0042]